MYAHVAGELFDVLLLLAELFADGEEPGGVSYVYMDGRDRGFV